MFTLTFTDGSSKTVVSAQRYDFSQFDGGNAASVIIHKDYFNEGGVEFRLGEPRLKKDQAFSTCFVTNELGKTIDRLGPYPVPITRVEDTPAMDT